MATFVLVPTNCTGSWYMKGVAQQLEVAGHDVYRLTLTGQGERSHLLTRDIGLETHITDVVNALVYEDLRDVVLVGHSYGGAVACGAAERVPERLAQIVLVDSPVLRDGECLADVFGPRSRDYIEMLVRTAGEGWLMPEAPIGTPNKKRTPHPAKCYADQLRLGDPRAAALPHTYICCTLDKNPDQLFGASLALSRERARQSGWRYWEIEATHGVCRTHPAELAALLMAAAESPA
jgi:pimeloyl-ACP methyl ester carboxylesterase